MSNNSAILDDPYAKKPGEDFDTWRWRTVWVTRPGLAGIAPAERLRAIREYLTRVVAIRPSCATMGCGGCVDGQITAFVRRSLEIPNEEN